MAFCNLCNCQIADEEAVPYLDAYGNYIKDGNKIAYRRWCLTHWAARRGALPPSHPDFLKPIDPRTRSKDRKKLGLRLKISDVHQTTIAPSPVPSPQDAPQPLFDPKPEHEFEHDLDISQMRLEQALESRNHSLAHAIINEQVKPHNPLDLLRSLSPAKTAQPREVFPSFYPAIYPKVDFFEWIESPACTITDATIVSRLEDKGVNTLKIVHYLKAMGYKPPRIASAVSKGLAYVVQLLAQPAPDLREAHTILDNTQVPQPAMPNPSPEPKLENDHIFSVKEILGGYNK